MFFKTPGHTVILWHRAYFVAVPFEFLSFPFLSRGSLRIDVRNHFDVFVSSDILNFVAGPESGTATKKERDSLSGDILIEAFIHMLCSPALSRYGSNARASAIQNVDAAVLVRLCRPRR